jgi:hypothetical protein
MDIDRSIKESTKKTEFIKIVNKNKLRFTLNSLDLTKKIVIIEIKKAENSRYRKIIIKTWSFLITKII